MLTASDFVRIPYSPDLTQAGIAYACRSLAHTYDRMGGSPSKRLRRIVTGVAVELAFRRHLAEQNVPHDNLGATPFTEPDRYDVALGGRRCDIKSFLISRKDKIRRLREDPAYLLQASALVPSDQLASETLQDRDLYVFAFVTGLTATGQEDLERAQNAGHPTHFIHPLPDNWARPSAWVSLGKLALKSNASGTLTLELGGRGESQEFRTERIELAPRRRVSIRSDFYSLAYLQTAQKPDERVGVHSPTLDQTYIVRPTDWSNIWVYGMEIFLAGYLTRGEFRKNARPLPPGSQVLQYERTRTHNMALPVANLRPLGDLLERAKGWGKRIP